jgi:hypothetical protein
MKKVFFLIAFLFTVVCFAAPPPDLPASFQIEDVGFIRSQEVTVDFSFDVQPEVAFSYIGNNSNLFLSDELNHFGYSNRLYSWQADKQNSNFGYPFGADY